MIVSRTTAEGFLGKKLEGLGAGKRSYYVLSADGTKNLGGPYTKPQAKKRIRQVEYFKHNPTPADPILYAQVTREAKKKFDVWPSIYASSWVVREYKKRGGRYMNPLEGLDKWFAEKWVDLGRSIDSKGHVKKWVVCGRPKAGEGGYPKCVPLAKAKKMTPAERLSAVRRKRLAESSAPKTKGRKPVMVKTFKDNPERKKLYIYPNEAAKKVARRALERRKELPKSKRGGLDALQAHEQGIGSGVMRARDIASGKRINAYQVKAFFDRHRHNYVKAKADGKKWEDSKAWQAWDLWGGEPLRKQVEAAVKKDKRKRAKENPKPKSDRMKKSMAKSSKPVREKPYTIYLVQDKPRGLVLYSFSSRDLISPNASASEYAWLVGQSALEKSGTHIFTSETKLSRFLRKSDRRIIRGRPRYPNPRNSKVKDALAAEAVEYEKFEEFSNAYWNACSRGLYWFATNERRFHIGLEERRRIKAGTFTVACSPELALQGRNEGKKYVAELDVTRLPKSAVQVKRGSGGAQIKIVSDPDGVSVTRVLEATKAKRSFKWQLSILPSSKEELRDIWKKAWEKRQREAEKQRIRKEKQIERELKRAEARAKEEAKAAERAEKKAKKKAQAASRSRIARSKAASRRKATAARAGATRRAAAQSKQRAGAYAAATKKTTSKKKATKKKVSKKKVSKKKVSKKKATKKKATKKTTSKKKTSRGKRVIIGPAETYDNPSKTRRVRVNVNKPKAR
jgi:hypothetical protein